jgi:hypothetical protein
MKVAGVEIIPLEPDQRSDLRREAPQCHTYLSSLLPLWGVGTELEITDILSSLFSP